MSLCAYDWQDTVDVCLWLSDHGMSLNCGAAVSTHTLQFLLQENGLMNRSSRPGYQMLYFLHESLSLFE